MKYIFTVISLLLSIVLHAQDANLIWAKRLGGSSFDRGLSVVVDASGNVYSTGRFSGTADFNPDPAVTNSLTAASVGNDDIFISKLDASGNFVWAKRMGGTSTDIGYSIAVDASGNVFATGLFYGTADLNPDPAITLNFTSAGSSDIYIIKLDPTGNFVWARQIGGPFNDEAFSIALDISGNIYTTGVFDATADFNPDPAVTNNLTSAGQQEIFVSKLNAAGNFVWAKQLGGTGQDRGYAIAVDALGNAYTTGFFSGTADFNPDPAVTNNLTTAGGPDIFISKLDASGNFVWAKQMGGTFEDNGSSIALDAAGNIYTTGGFDNTADLNPDPAVTNNFTSAGSYDIFITKLDAAGNFVWTRQMGGSLFDYASSIAINASGIYTTGEFVGTSDFNPDAGVNNNLTSAGSSDIFISKIDASGNFIWVKQMGGTQYDNGSAITIDPSGILYATGMFNGTADFNPDPAVTNNLTSAGSSDIFVLKLNQTAPLPVTLSGFTVQNNSCKAILNWTTATEQNSSHFEVQHSTDGINFSAAGTVSSGRNSVTEKKYTFSANLINQHNYFRLRMVDLDGSSKYSAVVNVSSNCNGKNIAVYPNPSKYKVVVSGLRGTNLLRISDKLGRVILIHKTTNSIETLNISRLPVGHYTIQVISDNRVKENFKLVKD